MGAKHACARKASGKVRCWGNNDYDQVSVSNDVFLQIDLGSWHSCGVLESAELACWGYNSDDQTDVDIDNDGHNVLQDCDDDSSSVGVCP